LARDALILTHRSEVYRFRADQAGRKCAFFGAPAAFSDLPLPMPKADEPNDKALESLDARLDAFEARKAAEKPVKAESEKANQDGYRLLADLIGGVLVGLGFGWLLDRYVHTSPWGMVGGLLIGLGLSIFSVVRKATKMSAQASAQSSSED
jgi:ATP synthase protein I